MTLKILLCVFITHQVVFCEKLTALNEPNMCDVCVDFANNLRSNPDLSALEADLPTSFLSAVKYSDEDVKV